MELLLKFSNKKSKGYNVTKQIVLNLTEHDEETLKELRGFFGTFPKNMHNSLGEIIIWYLEDYLNHLKYQKFINSCNLKVQ